MIFTHMWYSEMQSLPEHTVLHPCLLLRFGAETDSTKPPPQQLCLRLKKARCVHLKVALPSEDFRHTLGVEVGIHRFGGVGWVVELAGVASVQIEYSRQLVLLESNKCTRLVPQMHISILCKRGNAIAGQSETVFLCSKGRFWFIFVRIQLEDRVRRSASLATIFKIGDENKKWLVCTSITSTKAVPFHLSSSPSGPHLVSCPSMLRMRRVTQESCGLKRSLAMGTLLSPTSCICRSECLSRSS